MKPWALSQKTPTSDLQNRPQSPWFIFFLFPFVVFLLLLDFIHSFFSSCLVLWFLSSPFSIEWVADEDTKEKVIRNGLKVLRQYHAWAKKAIAVYHVDTFH